MAAGVACLPTDAFPTTLANMSLVELSAVQAAAALRRGKITAEQYANALLDRCDACKDLNAFIMLDHQRVLEAARRADRWRSAGNPVGLLHGLPVAIKDSINTADLPTTGGTPALRAFRPNTDAAIVQRLKQSGALVLGKTNLHELSFGWTSNNQNYGAVRNPYDRSRTAGGSSGGSAAAVSARMTPLGLAEDTFGSIRVPAALCGIVGFRPTTGRYPSTGIIPLSPLLDQVGPHARRATDVMLFDQAVTGEELQEPVALAGLRLGIARDYFFTDLDPEVERVTEAALGRLREAGAVLVEAEVPGLDELIDLIQTPLTYDIAPSLSQYLEEYGTGISLDEVLAQASPEIRNQFELYILPNGRYAARRQTYHTARNVYLPKLKETLATYFRQHQLAAMVFPTTRVAAVPLTQGAEVKIKGRSISLERALARNISPGSIAGLPGLVLPSGLTNGGLPVSLEFDGPVGSDPTILSLGPQVERELGRLPAPSLKHPAG